VSTARRFSCSRPELPSGYKANASDKLRGDQSRQLAETLPGLRLAAEWCALADRRPPLVVIGVAMSVDDIESVDAALLDRRAVAARVAFRAR